MLVIVLLSLSCLPPGVVGDMLRAADDQVAFRFVDSRGDQPAFCLSFADLFDFATLAANDVGDIHSFAPLLILSGDSHLCFYYKRKSLNVNKQLAKFAKL